MAIIFLRNAEQSRFGEMLFEYRKAFANKEDRYPRKIPDMVDIMRIIPEKKQKQTTKSPGKEKEKEKDKSASSFAMKEKSGEKKEEEERACYCCGKTTCLLPKCPEEKTKPKS